MSPEYPKFVKEALATDTYWQLGPLHSAENTKSDLIGEFVHAVNNIKIMKDESRVAEIVNSFMSAQEGCTITPIPYGERLPIPNNRQIVKVVEDSRFIFPKLDPPYWLLEAEKASSARRYRKYVDPDFQYPSFEENLRAIYDSPLPVGPSAEVVVSRGLLTYAKLIRQVLYLKYDQEKEKFAALPAVLAADPKAPSARVLNFIPLTEIGTVYKKNNKSADYMGRIVSADLIDITAVRWDHIQGNSTNKKQEEKARRRFGLAHRLGSLSLS
jgi:hypothetical protein